MVGVRACGFYPQSGVFTRDIILIIIKLMPLIKKCLICNKEFYTKPFFVKNGAGKYCSRECHYQGLKKGKIVKCFKCKKKIYRSPKSIKSSKSGKFFCSKSCQTKWRNQEFIGSKHSNWTGGRYSYRSVLGRNKIPKICCLCKNKDIRVMAVHHVDHNRKNNEVENLVWLCHNCHHLVHHYENEREKIMVSIA